MGRGVGQGLLNFGQFSRSLPSPVEAGLLAKAAGQSLYASQTNRFREQARSHSGFAVSGEPAMENLFRAGNPLVQTS